ncbi:uncharacterized protein N7498_000374 [Penicillium cinerascens]|uniref:Uncharacterized protein n=1 Tax=Penicillium cinerascens TaxID=70096 RepID=A0A9W9NE99_9EURO|nr:uncharacterized protein N7498_000374 [Penicillium cinerascens]KAJ5218275.1 hypothetical protein N7498_000374 [Penicillium cinerascens]
MSNGRPSEPISVPESDNRRRRGSIADLFSKRDSSANQAAANQANQQRRLSITTLGLSGSPTQASTFGNRGIRRGSLSSSWGSAPNEDAMAEDAEGSPPSASPSSPFARRVSFGAQALREARTGSIGNGRYPPGSSSTAGARPPPATAASSSKPRSPASTSTTPQDERSNASRRLGEGFNWSEALRSRAERAPSLGGPVSPQSHSATRQPGHQRAASIASMEQPVREIPKQPKQNKPDFFQEKILRGDFMD